jgi:hypothetical protein
MQEDLHGGSAEIRGKKMRESFVFHKDYIDDLPSQYKAEFTQYTVNYGLYGEHPPLTGDMLESALWAKIRRRIDTEAEKYEAISEKRKEAAQKRYQQYQQRTKPAREEPAKNEQAEQKAATPEESPAELQTAKPKKAAAFVKPTVEEIRAYCEERKNGLDAQAFFDFYESKGWKVGAAKMKDWRACVRTWEQRRKADQTGGKKAGGMWGKENEIPDEITDLF